MLLAISAELVAATGIGVALPDVAGSFGASPDETSWVLTLYLVGFTVVLPLTPVVVPVLVSMPPTEGAIRNAAPAPRRPS